MRLVDDKKPERLQNKHLIHDSETNRRRATRHGFYYEPWYSSYKSMMERCYHPKCRKYEQYGGRGIKICEEWHNINAFAEWVKTSGYEKGLSIDRINVNGDYCPENCRWATSKEQANNRRNNVFYEYKGESHTLAEWARITGINRYTLWSRINKQGWTIEMALSDRQDAVPVVRCRECENYDENGDCISLDLRIGIHSDTINYDFCPDPDFYCAYGRRKIETVLPKSDEKDEGLEVDHD